MSLSVLLLEDEPLIALDIEATLKSSAFNIAATLDTCEAAENWLAERHADVAILDINLRDGTCESVAKLLHDRDIPFVVHSGSSRSDEHHPIFLEGRWLAKPALPSDLIGAVKASVKRKMRCGG